MLVVFYALIDRSGSGTIFFFFIIAISRLLKVRRSRAMDIHMNNSSKSYYKLFMVLGFACVLLLFLVMDNYHALEPVDKAVIEAPAAYMGNITSITARKLLDLGDGNSTVNRIGTGTGCPAGNININQGSSTPLPNGIPMYGVSVENNCVQGSCTVYDIHLSCGWFSSARLVNPQIFRRIAYDDCLVNDGQPLNPGECVYFQYANTFSYPFSVSSIKCY